MKTKRASKRANKRTNGGQTKGKQRATNKNDKNIKNEEEVVVEQQLQKKFINCTGSTNINAIEECISYLDDLPYEVIERALLKTSEKNGGWKYAKKILQEWLMSGIKTIEQVNAEEENFKNKKNIKHSGLESWFKKMEEKEKEQNGI